ncbi:hypothetical protein [Cochlodiniinecator piscidefendens]|uniref:hypothetical protein n=1 Tax=Cochlodiniinecator piscidefendens TaxID=2715756 RepID=UPI00140C7F14|nr:hypothetical protein [Cochlodiniinecator piscidefendens]
MSALEDLADALAKDVLEAERKLKIDRLSEDIAKIIAESSTTLEENFMTYVRVRRAEVRGRKFLAERVKSAIEEHKAAQQKADK